MKGYIVSEFLPFIEIPYTFEEIVASFEERYESRNMGIIKSSHPRIIRISVLTSSKKMRMKTKIRNHLTVLTNAPGSGKSTALMNFPLPAALL